MTTFTQRAGQHQNLLLTNIDKFQIRILNNLQNEEMNVIGSHPAILARIGGAKPRADEHH